MATGAPALNVTIFVALTDSVPPTGDEYLITASEYRTLGKLGEVVLQRSHPQHPLWSRLALMEVEVSGLAATELMPEGRTRHIELCDVATGAPLATGLTVACKRAGPDPCSPPASPGLTIWFTGLSGAGKTTIAREVERILLRHRRVVILDADIVRTHICRGLGFSEEDRNENIRRLALLARMLTESGAVVLVAAISPYRMARDEARSQIGRFVEVYVNAPLSVCEDRDVKGLYKRARSGEIHAFTGIDDPYQPPLAPEIECRTDRETIDESVAKILAVVARQEKLRPQSAEAIGS